MDSQSSALNGRDRLLLAVLTLLVGATAVLAKGAYVLVAGGDPMIPQVGVTLTFAGLLVAFANFLRPMAAEFDGRHPALFQRAVVRGWAWLRALPRRL